MNKKSVIAANTVISLAILAIGLIVLFHVVFPEVKDVIVGEGEKGACEWSLVMHSITKLGDWSLIPAECRAHRIEIDMDYLSDYHKEAKNRIKTYINNKDKYAEILHFFNNPNDELQLNEWALNRIIAKETKDCWEKVFKGKLPLFESGWWNLISWDALGVSEAPKNENEACSFWIKILQDSFRIIPGEIKIPGTIKVYKPPVNCIICSRIKFSDDLKEYFKKNKKSEITSFDMWLRYNYPITGSLSYYEHIVEGQSSLKNSFSTRYPKYSLNFPLTVLYEKIYVRKDFFESLQDWRWLGTINNPFGIIISEIQKYTVYELNYVKLVPYTQESLIDQKNGEGCIFILD